MTPRSFGLGGVASVTALFKPFKDVLHLLIEGEQLRVVNESGSDDDGVAQGEAIFDSNLGSLCCNLSTDGNCRFKDLSDSLEFLSATIFKRGEQFS